MEYLGTTEIARLAVKRLLRGYEVPAMPFLERGLWLFQKGVVFGRARHDQLDLISKMFVGLDSTSNLFAVTGLRREWAMSEEMVLQYLRKLGSDAVRHYGRRVESFLDFWLTALTPPDLDFRDLLKIKQLTKQRIPLAGALQQADAWILAGISFGAMFPDDAQRVWKQDYETVDQNKWSEARGYGLDIPEQFTPLPLEEMEHMVLVEVAAYVTDYFPELVNPLGLRLA